MSRCGLELELAEELLVVVTALRGMDGSSGMAEVTYIGELPPLEPCVLIWSPEADCQTAKSMESGGVKASSLAE